MVDKVSRKRREVKELR